MKESNKLKRKRKPTGRMLSVSGQAAEKAGATTDLTMSERPLHDYMAEVSERTGVRIGVPLPMGTHEYGRGVNFAFFSRHASRVRLELFDHPEDARAARVIDLDPARNRTGDVWHVWVEGIGPGQLYAYRVDGPYEPSEGYRFNFNRLLLDPFASAITQTPEWDFTSALGYDPSAPEQDLAISKLDNSRSITRAGVASSGWSNNSSRTRLASRLKIAKLTPPPLSWVPKGRGEPARTSACSETSEI